MLLLYVSVVYVLKSISIDTLLWTKVHRFIQMSLVLFCFLICLFIFGCVGSSLLCTGFSLVVASRGYSSLRCTGLLTVVASRCRAHALGAWASVVVVHGLSSCGSQALEHRLSSCGTRG